MGAAWSFHGALWALLLLARVCLRVLLWSLARGQNQRPE